jgi:hypothetical protein
MEEIRYNAETEVIDLLSYPDLLTSQLKDIVKRSGYTNSRVRMARSIAMGNPESNAYHACPNAVAMWEDLRGVSGLMRRWKR